MINRFAFSSKYVRSVDATPTASVRPRTRARSAGIALCAVFAAVIGVAGLTGCDALPAGNVPGSSTTGSATGSGSATDELSKRLEQMWGQIGSGPSLRADSGDRGPSLVTVTGARTMDQYLTAIINDVHRYWGRVFTQAGEVAPKVSYRWPDAGKFWSTPCSTQLTTDESAFYCSTDDRITISQSFARKIWKGEGDFAVAFVVAHEYAHNVQDEVGILDAHLPTVNTELHADCLAGIWANSAYYEGILEAGDIEEGIAATQALGDFEFSDPDHHGTPDQRTAAFTKGYNSGSTVQCQSYLTVSF